jgi:hypothetical protein
VADRRRSAAVGRCPRADRARDRPGLDIRPEVTDGDQVASWEVIVRDGTATTAGANGSEPHAVVRIEVVDWLALNSGKTSGGELLFRGRLSIEGDESKVVSLLSELDREHQPF